MKPGGHIVLVNVARLYAPIMALFALTLLAARAPGDGVGFMAGAVFALVFVLHALVFGADALRAAFPPTAMRLTLAAGVTATVIGAGAPQLLFAAQIAEGGLAAATATTCGLIVVVLFGRAPTLRDDEW